MNVRVYQLHSLPFVIGHKLLAPIATKHKWPSGWIFLWRSLNCSRGKPRPLLILIRSWDSPAVDGLRGIESVVWKPSRLHWLAITLRVSHQLQKFSKLLALWVRRGHWLTNDYWETAWVRGFSLWANLDFFLAPLLGWRTPRLVALSILA